MRHPPPVAHEQDRIGTGQTRRDIVRVQDRHARGLGQPRPAHHQAIGPGDQQDRGAAIGRSRYRAAVILARIAGQEGRQMRLDPDRTHAGTAAAMRDGEGLVQVEVADVAADLARLHQPDKRVHVGPVDIDLAAMLVGDVANLAHGVLEDAVGRGIGDHHRRQLVARLGGLVRKILEVDVAVGR